MYVGVETRANRLLWESITRQPKVCLSGLSIFERKNDEDSEGNAIFVGGAHGSQGLCPVRIFWEAAQDFRGLAKFVAAAYVRQKVFPS